MGVLSDASVGAKNFVVNHREHQDRLEITIVKVTNKINS